MKIRLICHIQNLHQSSSTLRKRLRIGSLLAESFSTAEASGSTVSTCYYHQQSLKRLNCLMYGLSMTTAQTTVLSQEKRQANGIYLKILNYSMVMKVMQLPWSSHHTQHGLTDMLRMLCGSIESRSRICRLSNVENNGYYSISLYRLCAFQKYHHVRRVMLSRDKTPWTLRTKGLFPHQDSHDVLNYPTDGSGILWQDRVSLLSISRFLTVVSLCFAPDLVLSSVQKSCFIPSNLIKSANVAWPIKPHNSSSTVIAIIHEPHSRRASKIIILHHNRFIPLEISILFFRCQIAASTSPSTPEIMGRRSKYSALKSSRQTLSTR